MKRGFTLLELLVVVGIMAMLGVAASGGYAALQRGMAERGAVSVMNTFLKAAQERARVDCAPTVVFCYNKVLQAETEEDNAIVVGEAVAIRRAGRISFLANNLLYDEFADLDKTYDVRDKTSDLENCGEMKLWKFDDTSSSMGKMRYSIVSQGVYRGKSDYTEHSFAEAYEGRPADIPMAACAFYEKSSHGATWVVGSGYGFEFAKVQLPKNFIFGQTVPKNTKDVQEVKAFYFDPNSSGGQTVKVYFCRPDGTVSEAGEATSKEDAKS